MFYRFNDYIVLFYRIFLAYIFYSIARLLFYFYNNDIIIVYSINEFIELCLIGFTFDTSAILYTNAIFIIISLLPFRFVSKKNSQKNLFLLLSLSFSLISLILKLISALLSNILKCFKYFISLSYLLSLQKSR